MSGIKEVDLTPDLGLEFLREARKVLIHLTARMLRLKVFGGTPKQVQEVLDDLRRATGHMTL